MNDGNLGRLEFTLNSPISRQQTATSAGSVRLVASAGDPLVLRVEEAARRLAIGRTTMWSLIRSGDAPSVRIRGAVRVPTAALETWLSAQVRASEHKIGAEPPGPAPMTQEDGDRGAALPEPP